MRPTDSHALIADAILRTILYADVFSFPLTLTELHHYLIADRPYDLDEVRAALASSPLLMTQLTQREGWIALRDRSAIIDHRRDKVAVNAALLVQARTYGRWLARLPFVSMVGVTGSLAVANARSGDDIDYVLVTRQGRVWLTRLLAIGLVRLARLRGVVLCPNFVLSDAVLHQERHDLFMAHEVAQVMPIYGAEVYALLRASNPWVDAHLPNATAPLCAPMIDIGGGWAVLKHVGEAVLSGRIGDALDQWEHRRKADKLRRDLRESQHAAILSVEQVKGHFRDHGWRVMAAYASRLRDAGCDDESALLAQAGD